MRVARLPQNFEQRWIRYEEESWKEQTLLLQVSTERLLADLELFLEVGEELAQGVVPSATMHNIRVVMRSLHDLLPRLVDVRESFRLLRQLFGDVSPSEHGLQVDPKILYDQPVLDDFHGNRQFGYPFLNLGFERSIVSAIRDISNCKMYMFIVSINATEKSIIVIEPICFKHKL